MSLEAIELQTGAEVPGTEQTPAEPVTPVETPATPAAPVLEEKRYEYQPTDENGRAIGGKQVIKYTTPEELAAKLAEQNTLLLRKLRAETRKNRLGIVDADTIPDDAPRYEEPLTFEPRQLTDEERFQLSRDLLDPEKVADAGSLIVEATLGAKPEKVRKKLTTLDTNLLRLQAQIESDAFVAANPSYVRCNENFEAITNWMLRYDLAPVRQNFQKAYDTLKAAGVLVERYADVTPQEPEPAIAPVAPEPPTSTPVTPPEPAPAPAEPVAPKPSSASSVPGIPSGFTRDISDDTGAARPVGDDIVYEVTVNGQKKRYTGLAAINAMPSDEYKRRVMSDPTFAKKEAQLEKEAAERRKGARR